MNQFFPSTIRMILLFSAAIIIGRPVYATEQYYTAFSIYERPVEATTYEALPNLVPGYRHITKLVVRDGSDLNQRLQTEPSKVFKLNNQIKKLDLTNSNITLATLCFLSSFENVEVLKIQGCTQIQWNNDSQIVTLINNCKKHLQKLYIDSSVPESVLLAFLHEAKNLKCIKYIDANKTTQIYDSKEQLKQLTLKLDSANFLASTGYNFNLKKLSIEGVLLTSEIIKNIKLKAPNLETLILANCKGLSEALTDNAQLPATIRHLNLAGSDVTLKELAVFKNMLPNLRKLNLQNCKAIAWDNLEEVNKLPANKELETLRIDKDINPLAVNLLLRNEIDFTYTQKPYRRKRLFLKEINYRLYIGDEEENPKHYAQTLGYFVPEDSHITLFSARHDDKNADLLQKTDVTSASFLTVSAFLKYAKNNSNTTPLEKIQQITLKEISSLSEYYLSDFLKKAPNCTKVILCSSPIEPSFEKKHHSWPRQILHLCIQNDQKLTRNQLRSIVSNAQELQSLEVSNCPIRGSGPLDLPAMPKLRQLNLSWSKFSDDELDLFFDRAPNIQDLTLKDFEKPLELSLTKLSNLQQLDISFTNITLEELERWNNQRINSSEKTVLSPTISVTLNGISGLPPELQTTFATATELAEKIADCRAKQKFSNQAKEAIYGQIFSKKMLALAVVGTGIATWYTCFTLLSGIKKFLTNPNNAKNKALKATPIGQHTVLKNIKGVA